MIVSHVLAIPYDYTIYDSKFVTYMFHLDICMRVCVSRFPLVAGLGLLDMVKELQDVDNEALQTQLAVWEEAKAGDEEELEALGGIDLHNHEDAFKILMSKVGVVHEDDTKQMCTTIHSLPFFSPYPGIASLVCMLERKLVSWFLHVK